MKTVKNILRFLNILLKVLTVIIVCFLAVYNVNALVQRYAYGRGMPVLFGYASAVVVSGSMEPEISVNDLVITREGGSYGIGDIVTFYDSTKGEYVTHRIILVTENGDSYSYVTQGDANDAPDAFSVPQTSVVGKVVCVLRGAGTVISFLQTPAGFAVVLCVGGAVWILTDRLSGGKSGKTKEKE